MLPSGPEQPPLNFLPEASVVVLRESRIVAHPEDAWALLRKERAAMPRTVNLICSPSKTGDVELVILDTPTRRRRWIRSRLEDRRRRARDPRRCARPAAAACRHGVGTTGSPLS